jgi:hypothetical protein
MALSPATCYFLIPSVIFDEPVLSLRIVDNPVTVRASRVHKALTDVR